MTQIYSLADLIENGIEIRSLEEIKKERNRKRPDKIINKYFEIERKLIEEGKAVNLESYLLQEYQFNQKSVIQISKDLGISLMQGYYILDKLKIPTRNYQESSLIHNSLNKCSEESRKKMSEAKKGKNNPMYGIKGENHPSYGQKYSRREKPPREELVERYLKEERNLRELGKTYGVAPGTVKTWLTNEGVVLRDRKQTMGIVGRKYRRRISNSERGRLEKVTQRNDLTMAEKARQLGVSNQTLFRRLKELGLKPAHKKRESYREVELK